MSIQKINRRFVALLAFLFIPGLSQAQLLDFTIPDEIQHKLAELDEFIEREIKPLERENMQFFDHRREHARTDWDNGGKPRAEWEELLGEMRRRADAAGHLRFALPKELGGQDGSNLAMAVIREHLAAKGLGLHNDLQNESSIVGNFPSVIMMQHFGTEAQKAEFLQGMITGTHRLGFGLTAAVFESGNNVAGRHQSKICGIFGRAFRFG